MPAPAHPSLSAAAAALVQNPLARRLLELAREEDLGQPMGQPGDITTAACTTRSAAGRASIVARSGGVIAGLAAIPLILDVFGSHVELDPGTHDGARVEAGAHLGTLIGLTPDILAVERTLLNLLARLCGIATRTAEFVAAARAASPNAAVYDTRKTTPGLRIFEKYAVLCGGGHNHRAGLFDAVLLKDNHLAGVPLDRLAEFIATAAADARRAARARNQTLAFVEVEADSLAQFERILTLPAGTVDIVLLDNMSPADLRRAVQLRNSRGQSPALEASGGVTLASIGDIARTGVDRISVGSLTHSAPALDIALDFPGTQR